MINLRCEVYWPLKDLLLIYFILCIYMYVDSYKAKKDAIIITKIYVGDKLCITLDGSGWSDSLVGNGTYVFLAVITYSNRWCIYSQYFCCSI